MSDTAMAADTARSASDARISPVRGESCSRLRFALGSLLGLLILAFASRADGDDQTDPIPLRRILIPADRITEQLKRVEEGVLTRVTRKEFDSLVRSAARAVRDARLQPSLIEAKYQASLTDAPALVGSAQWKIVNPSTKSALLRLQSSAQAFNLAISRPRFDNRDAVVGDFPDPQSPGERTLALLVDQSGQQTVTLDWSARAESRPEGIQIDLRLPNAPAGLLELDLPADRSATSPDSLLISGPHPAEKSERRLWRIAVGGKTKLPLFIRKSESGKRSQLLARQKTVQKLTPDGLDSVSTFNLEALHQDIGEFVLEVDPLLRPIDVTAPGLARWDLEKQGVRVQLERPVREVTVSIRCLAPLFADQAGKQGEARVWVSPSVRLGGAVPRGETLELRIHPELRIDSWSPGDFLLDDSSSLPDPENRVTLRRLALRGGSLAPALDGKRSAPRRPSARLTASGVDYRVNRLVWWRLGADGMELSAQLDYQVRQGLLFQLPVRLPVGWEVAGVDLTPADSLRSWYVRQDKAGALLIVDLRQPLRATDAGPTTLHVGLRPRIVQSLTERDLLFPNVAPVAASFVEGGLALDYDEYLFSATVRTPTLASEVPLAGPWGASAPEHFYPDAAQPIKGTIRLSPRRFQLLARATTEVHLGGGRTGLVSRLHLEGQSGQSSSIDVYLGPGAAGPWDWQADRSGPRVRSVERLAPLDIAGGLRPFAARSPLGAALAYAASPAGSTWRLHLDRPLTPGKRLTLSASAALESKEPSVPLPVVLNASRFEGEVTLFLSGGEPGSLSAHGLREAALPRGVSAWRSLRYSDLNARLSVEVRPGRAADSSIDRAKLLTTSTGKELVHLFRFRLTRWHQRSVPIRLPEGAKLSAAAVNGHWLGRATADEEGIVELPVPAGESARFEVLYSMPARRGLFGATLTADAPSLPLPFAVERGWRLPPDVAPLWAGRTRLVPGDGAAPEMPTLWQRFGGLFRLGPRLSIPELTPSDPSARPQTLADATAALRARHAGKPLPLGEAVEEMSAYLKGAHPLLIDRVGLHRANIDRTTSLTFLPGSDGTAWEQAGLVLVPGSAGIVLTTTTQWQRWWRQGEGWPASVEEALTDTARLGRDSSGRFVTALEWRTGENPHEASAFLDGAIREGWSTWVPIAGQSSESLTVVRLPVVFGVGVLVGLSLLALLFALRGGARVAYLLAWLALAGLALAWLPSALADLAWWPLIFGLGASLIGLLVWASRGRPRVSRAAATGVAVLLAGFFLHGNDLAQAQKTEPELVFHLPASSPDKQAVLVSPKVLTRLRELAKLSAAPTSGAVLVDAGYEGKLVKGQPRFEATLNVLCLDEGPTTVEIPLDGVQLTGEVFVDGARAAPVALAAPKSGFALALKSKGRHKVQFAFESAVTGSGEATGVRSVKFSVPRLVQSRLVFRAGEGVTHLQVPVRHGAQKLVPEGKGTRLDVELGALAAPVQMRWHQEGKSAKPATVIYREAYLWELSPEASTLQAYFRYDVSEGAVTSFAIELPEGIDVRSVQARRPAGAAADAAVRVSDWSVGDSTRTLKVDLPAPVSGEVELTVELIPSGPWQGPASLALPKAQGKPAEQSASYVAYRAQGVSAQRIHQLGLKGIQPAEFAPFWSSRPRPDSLTYAGLFRRNQPPQLRLALAPRSPRVRLDHEVTLRIGPRQARWQTAVEVHSPDKDLLLLEWDVSAPGLTITDVSGAGVHRWTRTGNRLAVWLDPGVDRAKLTMSGIATLELPAAKKSDPPRLELPNLRPLRVESSVTRFTLAAETGLALQMQKVRNLKPRDPAGSPLMYLATNNDHGATLVLPPGPMSRAEIRTHAARLDREVTLSSTVDLRAVSGQRTFTIRLRDWAGRAWLDVPTGFAVLSESYRRSSGRREWNWVIELPPGPAKPIRAVVRGALPVEEAGEGFSMPDVSVSSTASERTLAIDETLLADSPTGVVTLPESGVIRSWRIRESNWGVRLRPRPRSDAGASIVLAEHRATADDSERWVHELEWLLTHEGPGTLLVSWPAAVELQWVGVDDIPMSHARLEQGALPISLPEPGGSRRVRIRWQYPRGRESFDRPDLSNPRVIGATAGPTLWTVGVPPGWEARGSTGASRRAVVELYRTRARLELARSSGGDAEALVQAGRSLRLAGLALDCGATGTAPDGKRLADWRSRLLIEYEALRVRAGVEIPTNEVRDLPRAATTPVSWVTEKGEDRPPSPRLVPNSKKQTSAALAFSGQWAMAILGCVVVAASAPLRTLARWLWPEAALLVGVVGWHMAGATPGVLFFFALWLAGRLILLGQVVGRWRRR